LSSDESNSIVGIDELSAGIVAISTIVEHGILTPIPL
jgi:hypothetical protein